MNARHAAVSSLTGRGGAGRSGTTLMPAAMQVIHLAAEIEPDCGQFVEWYLSIPIRELDNQTAHQLVASGDAELVIEFLRAIKCGKRG